MQGTLQHSPQQHCKAHYNTAHNKNPRNNTTQLTTLEGTLQHRSQHCKALYNTAHNNTARHTTTQLTTLQGTLQHSSQQCYKTHYNTAHNNATRHTTTQLTTTLQGTLQHTSQQRYKAHYNTAHNNATRHTTTQLTTTLQDTLSECSNKQQVALVVTVTEVWNELNRHTTATSDRPTVLTSTLTAGSRHWWQQQTLHRRTAVMTDWHNAGDSGTTISALYCSGE